LERLDFIFKPEVEMVNSLLFSELSLEILILNMDRRIEMRVFAEPSINSILNMLVNNVEITQ
jgi:hypothetical protein